MGRNLNIVNDWLRGDNLRPASINFVTDKSDLEKKKSNMKIGDSYIDDDGKQWEKTDYGWRSVPKTLTAIQETNHKCSGCQKEISLNNSHDTKSYAQSKLCFDCMIERDTELKIKGQYKNFEKTFIFKKQRDYVTSTISELKEFLHTLEQKDHLEFVNEFGDLEKWKDVSIDKVKEDIKKDISEGERCLKDINDQLELLNG